jgi:hypothetical protein
MLKIWLALSDISLEMPIRFGRRTEPGAATDKPARDAAVLTDGVLLAEWYIVRRLDEELKRARRHDRPLSVVVATPRLIPGERVTALELEVAAAAARAVARSTDLLGWLGSDSILMIMPETSPLGARSAVFRWRSDMVRRTRSMGGHQWQSRAIESPCSFETAKELLHAAADRLGRKEAA